MAQFAIGKRQVGGDAPTYFIADISANHDGELERARALIRLAAESGADAAKFQNFRAPQIVSARGFADLGAQLSHQASWTKPVAEVYADASLPWEWTPSLKAECDAVGIDYFSTPYDLEAVDLLDPFVDVFKIGSGDITWPELMDKVASKGKPVLLATGASSIGDVQRAMHTLGRWNVPVGLMQCNTNYTGSLGNFRHIHLNVLKTYRAMYPWAVLGLSDHTPGHAAVLGAVALGARVIEKHFTDDNRRPGPDHPFSMTPQTWREMVDRTRELEAALGDGDKRVTANEQETVIVQRRCVRAARPLARGARLTRDAVVFLRPAPRGAILPYELHDALGLALATNVAEGEALYWTMLDQ